MLPKGRDLPVSTSVAVPPFLKLLITVKCITGYVICHMLSEGCRNPSPRGAPAPHSTNWRVRSHAIASPHTQPGNSRLRCSLGRLAAPQSPGNGPPSVSIPRGGMPMTELRNRQYRHIGVHPIAGSLGAEIDGVDLSQELDDEVLGEIRSALH